MIRSSLHDVAEDTRIVLFHGSSLPVGRPSLIADVALLLAAASRRVLVVDWTTHGQSVLRTLRHSPARELATTEQGRGIVAALRQAFGTPMEATASELRKWSNGRWWRIETAALPGELVVAGFTAHTAGQGQVPDKLDDHDLVRLCSALRSESPFDVVLVDQTGWRSGVGPDLVIGSSDAVVVTAEGTDGSVEGARDLALRLLDRRPDDLRVVCAAFDAGYGPDVVGTAELALEAFATPRLRPGAVTIVPVPLLPPSGAGLPAVLFEPSSGAAEAARLVAEALTDISVGPLPPHLPVNFALARGAIPAEQAVAVAYSPRDRAVADLVATWLQAAKVRPRRLSDISDGPVPVVAVLSQQLVESAEAVRGLPPGAVGVAVAPVMTDLLAERRIDLVGVPAADRRAVLLGALDLYLGAPEPELRSTPPEPVLRAGRLPGRDALFVGRDELLEAVRDVFAAIGSSASTGRRSLVLRGGAGVGKSAAATEYAHRFDRSYAGVLWITARTSASVRQALAELARDKGWITSRGAVEAALRHLGERAGRRWLLVLDDAGPGVLDVVGDLDADLLATTTEDLSEADKTLEVSPLAQHEGVAVLRNASSGLVALSDEEAGEVSDMAEGQPLPLVIAAACLRDAVHQLQTAQGGTEHAQQVAVENLREALASGPGEGMSVVARMLEVARQALQRDRHGRLALRVAELCSFLSADGVDLELVRSRRFIERLAASPDGEGRLLLEDELEIDRILALGSRFGLFQADWSTPASLRMHRVLQQGIRELLKPADHHARQADALQALARYAPYRFDTVRGLPAMVELRHHFTTCGVAGSTEREEIRERLGDPQQPESAAWDVRRWVVEHLGFVLHTGERDDWLAALGVVEDIEGSWLEEYGRDDPLCCRLADRRGGLLYALGRTDEALAVDAEALEDMRRALGPRHPRTVRSAGGLAGDLRNLGRFDDALPDIENVFADLRETYGVDHPQTLAAGFNLAEARFLSGRHAEALALHRVCHRDRLRVLGDAHPWFRESLRCLGVYLRETGAYREAEQHLGEAELMVASGRAPTEDPEHLRVQRALAVIRRRVGPRDRYLVSEGERLVRQLDWTLGPEHPETLAARLGQALTLAWVANPGHAVDLAAGTARRIEAVLGAEHPCTGAALVDLALVISAAKEHERALAVMDDAARRLASTISDVHPWNLAVMSDRARLRALLGDDPGTRSAVEEAHELCAEYLSPTHPVARAVAHNVEVFRYLGTRDAAARWIDIDIDIPSI